MTSLLGFRLSILVLCIIAIYFGSKDPAVERLKIKEKMRRLASTVPPSSCIQDGMIALTFDNGVSTNFTPSVLNVLKTKKVNATFHVSTEWLGVDSILDSVVRRIVADGHTLGLSWNGPSPVGLDDATLYTKLRQMSDTIFNVAKVRPRFLRVPIYTAPQPDLERKLAELGFVQTWWNIDPKDYQSCPPQPNASFVPSPEIIASAVNAYKSKLDVVKSDGNIAPSFISVHMDLCAISTELQQIIDLINSNYQNYKFVTLDECRGVSSKYMDAAPSLIISTTSSTSSTSTTTSSSTSTTPSSTPVPKATVSSSGGSILFGFDGFSVRTFSAWVAIAILGTFFMF